MLKGKTALITGAARRIGKGMARALASHGVNIVAHYHQSETEAENLLEELKEFSVDACCVSGDLSSRRDVESVFSNALAFKGQVDILINNASVFNESTLYSFSEEDLRSDTMINSFSPLLLSRKMHVQNKENAIINLLDARIHDYDKNHVSYHLSKQLLFSLTKMLAIEFAPKTRVNAVAPGLILPPKGKDESYLQDLAHTNPLNRYGGLKDITDAVLFLLQSRFITGQVIYVDGGRHLKGNVYGS